MKNFYVPVTPGGTVCAWLISETESGAWESLLEDASHMPYGTRENFIERGYTVITIHEKEGCDQKEDRE